jgi:CheY-like chemotaxis protein
MARSNLMQCNVCGGSTLFATEYITGSTVRAPALRCAECDAIHLDEAVARSPEERESIRMAKAEREAHGPMDERAHAPTPIDSGSRFHGVSASTAGCPGPPRRVLLVDDDPIQSAGYSQLLQHSGWVVVTESDAKLARRRIATDRFDVIVTDLVMPQMGGVDLLRTAREYDADVPVVILTGQADLQSAMDAVQHGAFQYIEKPVPFETLLDVLVRARDLHLMAKFKREALSLLHLPNRDLADNAAVEARLSSALQSLWDAVRSSP